MKQLLSGWKHLVALAMKEELPVPAFSSALNYFLFTRLRQLTGEYDSGTARLFRSAHL